MHPSQGATVLVLMRISIPLIRSPLYLLFSDALSQNPNGAVFSRWARSANICVKEIMTHQNGIRPPFVINAFKAIFIKFLFLFHSYSSLVSPASHSLYIRIKSSSSIVTRIGALFFLWNTAGRFPLPFAVASLLACSIQS